MDTIKLNRRTLLVGAAAMLCKREECARPRERASAAGSERSYGQTHTRH